MRSSLLLVIAILLPGAACSTPGAGDDTSAIAGAGGNAGAPSAGSAGNAGGVHQAGTGGTTGGANAGGSGGVGGAGAAAGGNSGAGVGGISGGGGNAGAGVAGSAGVGAGGSGIAGAAGSAGEGVAGAAGLGGAGGRAAVENGSADCAVGALSDAAMLPVIRKLPDPFIKLDGTRMTKRSEWRCRRQEILEQAKKYIYGDRPAFDVVSGTVTNNQISVHVEALGESIDFTATVVLPTNGAPPFPAIINVGSRAGAGTTLGESRLLEQGVAVIYYNMYDLGREGQPEQSRGDPNPGLFYDIYGGTHSAGLLQAWSWGASRLIDVIYQSDGSIISPPDLGVTGCSRNGKGAFAVGLFDERIALTIPHEPSTGGDPAYRIVDVLNTERTDHNYYGLNWLSNDFEPFVYANNQSNAVKLPIDTHSLIATMAPRGVLVLENPHQTQMSAPAGYVATVAGAEVFEALGIAANVSYHSNVAQTPHCSYKPEYTDVLVQSIAHFLKHEGEPPGEINPGSNGTLPLTDWIDWTAPTLEADVTF